mmetsp:Transcript_17838/g.17562  ORF Transcript_17838/g.17562 Transcript_17838/m.17562 type:complete len:131 (-) Transcript_17838:146-538(-)|eukprot:CAMPEP_0196994908 /NCGR_PEP_ID=MMETSP1380-20130617/1121_1 /TAXON_ID=5936 /ORGANISM="Euplotes crassus, Strain CT5" /LENGTH=130 /DNA_ID=CAMNT_0042410407 /DNA_START=10 /DNA_END=402 /DNA_ORIENTATION=-
MKDKRQMYKLYKSSSNESNSSEESYPEEKKEDCKSDESGSSKKIEFSSSSEMEEYYKSCMTESPLYSSLNLPMIVEEEAESEYGKPIADLNLESDDEDDSPFFVVPTSKLSFEDRCEYSGLMKQIWNHSK